MNKIDMLIVLCFKKGAGWREENGRNKDVIRLPAPQ